MFILKRRDTNFQTCETPLRYHTCITLVRGIVLWVTEMGLCIQGHLPNL